MFTATSVQVTTAAREPAHPPNIALAALVPRSHALDALLSHRSRAQAVRARGPSTAHARHVCLPARVSEAGGRNGRVRRPATGTGRPRAGSTHILIQLSR